MDNTETQVTFDTGNITKTTKTNKNGQYRDTGNIWHRKHNEDKKKQKHNTENLCCN